jgi:mannose-6-phosphate isomerase-like protein (cupin superfamily)
VSVIEKVNLAEKLASIEEPWDPRIVGELNGQHVKLARLEGEFVWHAHLQEDELFLVLRGRLAMQFRDRTVTMEEGEFLIVPRGVEHCPRADAPVEVLLFEPVGTVNTGTAGGGRTVTDPEWL